MAWDGKTLAADKRATIGGVRTTVTKIRRGKAGNLVGVSGSAAMIESIFAWLCDGAHKPEGQDDRSDWCGIIEIDPQGRCYKHERWGRFLVEAPFFAVGSGADFALMAMELGRGAAEAVELTARFDTGTGDGVDLLELEAPRRRTVAVSAARAPAKRAKAAGK